MFKQAKAVFPRGMADQMHTLATFRACVKDLTDATLYIAAADFYQVCVNGRFVAFGTGFCQKGFVSKGRCCSNFLQIQPQGIIFIQFGRIQAVL